MQATANTTAKMLSNLPSVGEPVRVMVYDLHTLQNRFYFCNHAVATLHSTFPLIIDVIRNSSRGGSSSGGGSGSSGGSNSSSSSSSSGGGGGGGVGGGGSGGGSRGGGGGGSDEDDDDLDDDDDRAASAAAAAGGRGVGGVSGTEPANKRRRKLTQNKQQPAALALLPAASAPIDCVAFPDDGAEKRCVGRALRYYRTNERTNERSGRPHPPAPRSLAAGRRAPATAIRSWSSLRKAELDACC
jgi:hypothetical protein